MDASREVLAIDVATMIRRRLIEGSSAGRPEEIDRQAAVLLVDISGFTR